MARSVDRIVDIDRRGERDRRPGEAAEWHKVVVVEHAAVPETAREQERSRYGCDTCPNVLRFLLLTSCCQDVFMIPVSFLVSFQLTSDDIWKKSNASPFGFAVENRHRSWIGRIPSHSRHSKALRVTPPAVVAGIPFVATTQGVHAHESCRLRSSQPLWREGRQRPA